MRRTYRSIKDTDGALDHRDVILNIDEKSSAFDAFYIRNLKQTKRELSSVALPNHVGIASNKLRKRKYVKRLVKEVEPVRQREQSSTSAYLTPDKSIRVNKVLDPFDMLLNSSFGTHEPRKSEIVISPKKESKTYERKRKPKIKKLHYSSTESDKENTIDSNTTDIRTHELLIEKEPSNSFKCVDESITKIVGNLSLINKLKRKAANGSFNTSYKTRNRLTKNYQAPILQKSPLCSTPFKEKYRGVSIFKFSPITLKEQMSPAFDDNDVNRSLILVSKSLVPKSPNAYKISSLAHITNISSKNKTNVSVNVSNDNSNVTVAEDKVQNEIEGFDNQKQSDNDISNNDHSSFQITEAEPFLGFSNNGAEDSTKGKMQIMCEGLKNQSLQDVDIDENELLNNKSDHNILSNIDTYQNELETKESDSDNSTSHIATDENELVTNKSAPADSLSYIETDEDQLRTVKTFVTNKSDSDDSSSSIDTNENELETKKTYPDDSSSYSTDENYSTNASLINVLQSNNSTDASKSIANTNNKNELETKKPYPDESSSYSTDENDSTNSSSINELQSNTSTDASKSIANTSIYSNKANTSESTVHSESSDSESLYDTCSSDHSSIVDENTVKKEPIVAIKRISDSLFLNYYEKMLKSQDGGMSEQTDNEDFESLANESIVDTMDLSNSNSSESDEVQANDIVITDSSTADDVVSTDESDNVDESNEKDEKYVSFVTTRRRNEITNDSMFQLDQSYGSSSTDCNKTVISNRTIINKTDNTNEDNNPDDNLIEKEDAKENQEALKYNSVQDKIIPRKSTRRSRFSNISKTISPQINVDKSDDTDNIDRISMINTRRGSRISRKSNAIKLVSPTLKPKLSKSPSKKTISKINTRKSSRLPKRSHSTSSEVDNIKNIATLVNTMEVNMTVIENISENELNKLENSQITVIENTSENESNKLENSQILEDSISPLADENMSCMFNGSEVSHPERTSYAGAEVKPTIVLQPGKKWERSLSIYRRMTMVADHFDQSILDDCKQNKGRKYRQSVIDTMEMQQYRDSLHNDSINSRRSTFVSNPGRHTIRFVKDPNFSRVSLNTSSVFDDLKGFLSEECDDTVIELSKLSIADSEREVTILDNFHESERVTTARDYVLRRCNQTEPILFDECYPETVLKNCHKIGEGVYGEVFLWRARDGRARVMKVVPIAGLVKVNGEHQKDFDEIIAEIVIAMELSALRAPIADIERQLDEGNDIHAVDLHAIDNATDIFNEVLAVRCVHGPYPSRLLDLWELFDECKGSENDNPGALPVDQRYIVLELANAGQDLESYQFASAQQAYALFQQLAFGLAVAEEAFQFEHRDLHWGNVLIAPTEQKFATFVLRGRTYRVPRRGVACTVIDYSLSRLTLPRAADCAALYNDLAADEQLFDAVGDYQFEVYRLMRDKLGNDWKNFEPYTNILWLHYIVDKMITALRYKRTNTKIHRHYIEKLKGIKDSILEYGSAVQYVLTDIDF